MNRQAMVAGNLNEQDIVSQLIPESGSSLNLLYAKALAKKYQNLDVSCFYDFLFKIQTTGALPQKDEIYLIPRFDKKLGREIGTVIYSYHFFNKKAQLTGEITKRECEVVVARYDFLNHNTGKVIKSENVLCAIATVGRKGCTDKVFKAYYPEFVPKDYAGMPKPNKTWRSMPYVMLEKCALANALRLQFPDHLEGMFISEEMGKEVEIKQDGNDFEIISKVDKVSIQKMIKFFKNDNVKMDLINGFVGFDIENINEIDEKKFNILVDVFEKYLQKKAIENDKLKNEILNKGGVV